MIILQNGTIVDPDSGYVGKKDVAIENGIIAAIEENIVGKEEDTIIDCNGKIIGPGLVDVHVHFRDPGFTYKEDIYSGSKAAIKGGFTSVILMANTKPAVDNPETIEYILKKGRETGIRVYTCATITKGMAGKEKNDFEALLKAGACGFTDDGVPIMDENLVREVMEDAAKCNTVLSFHEEDPKYIENNGVNRGKASAYYEIGGSDRQAEITMVERDIKIALETGTIVNFQHISTKEAVELIREAKKKGNNIHAEATPHHIALTEDAVIEHNTLAKMNPPLRTEEDRQAIIAGLQDGTIDLIATDHAPHSAEEKARPITEAPSGILGLETAFALSKEKLVDSGKIDVLQLFCKMSKNPRELYGINAGKLAKNSPADLVVVDMDKKWKVETFASKSQNSPFKNKEFTGKIVMTICDGKILYQE